MKAVITAAAALLALQLPLALPAKAETKCNMVEGTRICIDLESGAYEVRVLSQPDFYVAGICSGRVVWGGFSYPAIRELHQIVCGKDANLQVTN